MLLKTVITRYSSTSIDTIRQEMLKLGLAQNVHIAYYLEGDYVNPELLGCTPKGYLMRLRMLQTKANCQGHVVIAD